MEDLKELQQISKTLVGQIVIDFLREKKDAEKIDIAMVEEQKEGWIVRGTCPIDLEGHKWAERFTVILDQKGKVKTTDFALL